MPAELSAVEFVAVIVGGEVTGFCGEWGVFEVRVVEGVDCVYAAAPVEAEEFGQEGYC